MPRTYNIHFSSTSKFTAEVMPSANLPLIYVPQADQGNVLVIKPELNGEEIPVVGLNIWRETRVALVVGQSICFWRMRAGTTKIFLCWVFYKVVLRDYWWHEPTQFS